MDGILSFDCHSTTAIHFEKTALLLTGFINGQPDDDHDGHYAHCGGGNAKATARNESRGVTGPFVPFVSLPK